MGAFIVVSYVILAFTRTCLAQGGGPASSIPVTDFPPESSSIPGFGTFVATPTAIASMIASPSTSYATRTATLVIPDIVFSPSPTPISFTGTASEDSNGITFFTFDCPSAVASSYCNPDSTGSGKFFNFTASDYSTTYQLQNRYVTCEQVK